MPPVKERMAQKTAERRRRLERLATALNLTPPKEGRGLRVSRDYDNKWWLCGCAEGDAVLPLSKNAPTVQEALDAAEGWLVPELTRLEKVDE